MMRGIYSGLCADLVSHGYYLGGDSCVLDIALRRWGAGGVLITLLASSFMYGQSTSGVGWGGGWGGVNKVVGLFSCWPSGPHIIPILFQKSHQSLIDLIVESHLFTWGFMAAFSRPSCIRSWVGVGWEGGRRTWIPSQAIRKAKDTRHYPPLRQWLCG